MSDLTSGVLKGKGLLHVMTLQLNTHTPHHVATVHVGRFCSSLPSNSNKAFIAVESLALSEVWMQYWFETFEWEWTHAKNCDYIIVCSIIIIFAATGSVLCRGLQVKGLTRLPECHLYCRYCVYIYIYIQMALHLKSALCSVFLLCI